MDNLLQQVVLLLFNFLSTIVSIILIPVDFAINAIFPQATQGVINFFEWVSSMIAMFNDFLVFFLYVIGITPATWGLIMTSITTLLLIWIILFPFKLILNTFRGFKDGA